MHQLYLYKRRGNYYLFIYISKKKRARFTAKNSKNLWNDKMPGKWTRHYTWIIKENFTMHQLHLYKRRGKYDISYFFKVWLMILLPKRWNSVNWKLSHNYCCHLTSFSCRQKILARTLYWQEKLKTREMTTKWNSVNWKFDEFSLPLTLLTKKLVKWRCDEIAK